MTDATRAFAPAKINLSLTVHGKRADGYHQLTSLVTFADVGDTLTVTPSPRFGLRTFGPTAPRIDGPNLIETAATRLTARARDFAPGQVTLEKILPVGAGVGGGSSDVAAYLRAMRRASPSSLADVDWDDLALSLGADVPVCLEGRTIWMRGIGETLVSLTTPLAPIHAVLVNPGVPVPTGPVFQALAAENLADDAGLATLPEVSNAWSHLSMLSNDLEAPALDLVPDIRRVRTALENSAGVRVVRMSGSGATYFGLYDSADDADAAARYIGELYSDWWVVPTALGDAPADDILAATD